MWCARIGSSSSCVGCSPAAFISRSSARSGFSCFMTWNFPVFLLLSLLSHRHRHTKLSNNDVVFYLFILRVFSKMKMEMVYRQLSNVWKLCCRGALSSAPHPRHSPPNVRTFELSSISVFRGSVFSIFFFFFFFSPPSVSSSWKRRNWKTISCKRRGAAAAGCSRFSPETPANAKMLEKRNAQDVERDDADDRSGP